MRWILKLDEDNIYSDKGGELGKAEQEGRQVKTNKIKEKS